MITMKYVQVQFKHITWYTSTRVSPPIGWKTRPDPFVVPSTIVVTQTSEKKHESSVGHEETNLESSTKCQRKSDRRKSLTLGVLSSIKTDRTSDDIGVVDQITDRISSVNYL